MDELETAHPGQGATAPEAMDAEAQRRAPVPSRRWLKRQMLIAVVLATVAGVAAGFALPRPSHPARPIRKIVLVSSNGPNVATGGQITVTGAATVQGTPDTVTFSIGVNTTAASASSALSENNAEVRKMERALQATGVKADEMQTSSVVINTDTDSSGNVTGFSVNDQLQVTMDQVSDAGSALDAAATSVGNDVNLNGISFSISNTSSLLATARAQAMDNARTEANQLAAGAGLRLGAIVKISDEENAEPTYEYGNGLPAAAFSASVPLERGTQPISVQVSVVYDLVS